MTDTAAPRAVPRRGRSAPRPFRVEGLLLLDPAGNGPVAIDSVRFADDGIAVVRASGQEPRVLPWTSVVAHAVEPWRGGTIPERWLDPTTGQTDRDPSVVPGGPGPSPADRSLTRTGSGALITLQTPTGTFRFLLLGGDPRELSRHISAFAVRHRGQAGASTVTTMATAPPARRARRRDRPGWSRIEPYLVVALVAVVLLAVALILLQTAGLVHLPLLGGGGSGSLGRIRPVPGYG